MFIDARTLPIGETIDTDVCIVGAGPAGTTLARELAGQNFRVSLIESGGLEFDEAVQALSQGEVTTSHFYPKDEMTHGRWRQLGGASNAWDIKIQMGETQCHVRHAPLDPIDFEKRDWLPYSGWPIDYNHLVPYYEKAQVYCEAGPFAYDGALWADNQAPVLPLGDRLPTSVFQFGTAAAFSQVPRRELNKIENVTTYYYANVLEIETNDTASTVTRLRLASTPGREFGITAKLVILATGGFENARLLLLSDKVQKNGLGNEHDLVGRFFMDHPGFRIGVFVPRDRTIFDSANFYDLRRVNGTPILGKIQLAEAILKREKILNIGIMLVPKPDGYGLATKSVMTLVGALRRGKLPKDAGKHIGKVLSNLQDTAIFTYRRAKKLYSRYSASRGGWSTLPDRAKKFRFFEAVAQVEQAPHPNNRVTLSQERDMFDRPKIEMYWEWVDLDLHSIRRTAEILEEEFARTGLGYFQSMYDLNGATSNVNGKEVPRFKSTHHHIGTTRMSDDPTQGVVDANCKVHGVSNLYIAGSSVFPTGGYANPTLTVVALAVRLADHVKQVMANNLVTTQV